MRWGQAELKRQGTLKSQSGLQCNAPGAGVYRDNTVLNFSTAYSGGKNGGGNI